MIGHVIASTGLAATLAVVACGSTGTTGNSVAGASSSTAPTPLPTAFPTSTPTASLEKPVGGTFTETSVNGDYSYSVQLTQIIDPAEPQQYDTINNTTHLVATVFTITGIKGIAESDVYNLAAVIGSDGVTYMWKGHTTASCSNFNFGVFSVTPTQVVNGCASMLLPNGVTITKVTWAKNVTWVA